MGHANFDIIILINQLKNDSGVQTASEKEDPDLKRHYVLMTL